MTGQVTCAWAGVVKAQAAVAFGQEQAEQRYKNRSTSQPANQTTSRPDKKHQTDKTTNHPTHQIRNYATHQKNKTFDALTVAKTMKIYRFYYRETVRRIYKQTIRETTSEFLKTEKSVKTNDKNR